MKFISALTASIFYISSIVHAANTAAWKSRTIYFVLTDRIARSSSDTGGNACGSLGQYCGGTFQGLQSKLDYIKGAGFDAIWITPVVKNSAGGYHGYWAQDLYSVNENYGTANDLKALVSAAHAKGIYIMVDVVANHVGFASISDNLPAPLNQESSYHAKCDIDYDNQTSVEQCRIAGLPDVNTSKAEIRTLYQTWIKWLVNEYSFDGVRIDTVKHVEKDFWPGFSQAAGVYSIGEAFTGDPVALASYAKTMPGLLNYAMYYPMNRFYQQQGSAQDIVDMHKTISDTFPDPSALGTFLDNHDNPRWLNEKNDVSLLKNALAYVMLARGIPIVYYGTEQGYSGGTDPANREDLWRSKFNTKSDLYTAISKLSGARKTAGGLAADDHVHLYTATNAYAWSRAGGNLIVLTTNTGAGTSGKYCFNAQRNNGKWTCAFGSTLDVTSDGSGNICLNVSNGEPVVLIAGHASTPALPSVTTTKNTVIPTTTKPLTTLTTSACPTAVSVTFSQNVTTGYGESVKVTGNTKQLGNWAVADAPLLSASKYPVWSTTVQLPAGKEVQYKFVKVSGSGKVSWESDPNRAYKVPACQASASVASTWR
ncbi:carbohydrate-binding module family 20 protein [Pleomassaria siparia CBS 279.74]|uniref:Alpha-amylase n=1 Tax=Pleomassaria siparia CBS 279.74 TaxID=1314801 RepID=A0A6G1K9A3_9PLEO|nr:carbohydrate-binding module family 20 protein [Pleomassaria siparia CBS 279.74]